MKMKFNFARSIFIDTSNIEEIIKWNKTGLIDGVTTNQYIMLKDNINCANFFSTIKCICKEMKNKPVSVELTDSSLSENEMVKQAKQLNNIADNIVVKVPIIPDSVKSLNIISRLIKADIAVNATIVMTFEQMVMAILALRNSKKPSFVSLFYGRSIEDHAKYRSRSDFMAKYPKVGYDLEVNNSPKTILQAAANFLKEGAYHNIKIIAGSIRTATMAGEAFAAGANIVTIAPDKLISMLFSQRTIETMAQFDEAWKKLQSNTKD